MIRSDVHTHAIIERHFPSPPMALLDWTLDQQEIFHAMQMVRRGRAKLRTLVVEDQLFSCKLLHGMLNMTCTVDVAPTMKRGWELYIEKAPDIIFIDIMLDGYNGHDLARRVKQVDSEAHVIMVTANNHIEEVEAARRNNVDGFIVKPYNKQQVVARIEQYITKRKAFARKGSRL